MMPKLFTLLFSTLLYCGPYAAAQVLPWKHLTTTDGLPSNTVYHAVRDSRGFMWFCTDKGLSRYDGSGFRNFTVADGLPSNTVFNLHEDAAERLWIFSLGGPPAFLQGDSFHLLPRISFPQNRGTSPRFLNAVMVEQRRLLFGYDDGTLVQMDGSAGHWRRQIQELNGKVLAIEAVNGLIAIHTLGGVFHMQNGRATRVANGPNWAFPGANGLVRCTGKDIRVTVKGKEQVHYYDSSLKLDQIVHLYSDAFGRVYCSTPAGLLVYTPGKDSPQKLLPGMFITSVMEDGYRDIYATTLNQGVWVLPCAWPTAGTSGLLTAPSRRVAGNKALVYSHGHHWQMIDASAHGMLRRVSLPISDERTEPVFADSNYFIFNDTRDGLCRVLDRHTGRTAVLRRTITKHAQRYGDSLIITANHESLAAHRRRAGRWSLAYRKEFTNHVNTEALASDKTHLYALAGAGLWQYAPQSGILSLIDTLPEDATGWTLFLSQNWLLATAGTKAVLYDIRTQRRQAVIENMPFLLYNVEPVNDGRVLLTTDKGLYLIDPTQHGASWLLQQLHYPVRGRSLRAVHAVGAFAVFETENDLLAYPQNIVNRASQKPHLYIQRIAVDGRLVRGSAVTLKGQNSYDLSATLEAVRPSDGEVRFYYRFCASDDCEDWHLIDGNQFSLRESRFGARTLQLACSDPDGILSEVRSVTINLKAPFYRTTVFTFLVVLFLVGTGSLLVRRALQQRTNRFNAELKYLQLEHKAINALLNPHFVFNALNNIQNLIGSGQRDTANHYIASISRMIRQNIDNLQHNTVSLAKELELIVNYVSLQNLRFGNRIRLTVDTGSVDVEHLIVLPLLLHVFVENAIVHGLRSDGSDLSIEITAEITSSGYAVIRITDDGNGIARLDASSAKQAVQKQSLGISSSRRRLERLSAFYGVQGEILITDRSEDDKQGTEVTILIHAGLAQKLAQTNGRSPDH